MAKPTQMGTILLKRLGRCLVVRASARAKYLNQKMPHDLRGGQRSSTRTQCEGDPLWLRAPRDPGGAGGAKLRGALRGRLPVGPPTRSMKRCGAGTCARQES